MHGCGARERVNVKAVPVSHIKAELVRVCSLRRRGGGRCKGGRRRGVIREGVAEVEVISKLRVRAGQRC